MRPLISGGGIMQGVQPVTSGKAQDSTMCLDFDLLLELLAS